MAYLVALGGQDPLAHFTKELTLAFRRLEDAIDRAVLEAPHEVRVNGVRIDLEGLGIKGPFIDVDVPRQRRPVSESDRHDAHRARSNDDRDLRGRDDAAAACSVGLRCSMAAKRRETQGRPHSTAEMML